MCICINCKWVDRCITYHDVEKNHGVDHICEKPDIKAREPLIHVSVVKGNDGIHSVDWDVRGCKTYAEEIGRWSKLRPGLELPQ